MMRSEALVSILIVLAILSSVVVVVYADSNQVQELGITECMFTNASFDGYVDANTAFVCNSNVTISCMVNDTTPATAVNSVQVRVGSRTFDLVNQSPGKAARWAVTISVDPSLAKDATTNVTRLESVSGTNSNGLTCTTTADVAQPTLVPEGCYITFTPVQRSLKNMCACGYAAQQLCVATNQMCCVDNTALLINTPLPGCEGLSAFNTTTICDFCDPRWASTSNACVVNWSMPAGSTPGPFDGTMTRTYVSLNQSCCIATGLAQDCTPPSQSGLELTCSQSYWLKEGREAGSTGAWRIRSTDTGNMKYDNFTAFAFSNGNTSYVRYNSRVPAYPQDPIVFDWDGNGMTEVLVQSSDFNSPSGAKLRIFSNNGSLLYSYNFSAGTFWEGPGSIAGFTEYYDLGRKYAWDPSVQNKSKNAEFVGILFNGDDAFFVSLRVKNGALTLNLSKNVSAVTCTACVDASNARYKADLYQEIALGQGVSCFKNDCYFMTTKGLLVKMNAETGVYKSINANDPMQQLDGAGTPPYIDSNSPANCPSPVLVPNVPALTIKDDVVRAVTVKKAMYVDGGLASPAECTSSYCCADAIGVSTIIVRSYEAPLGSDCFDAYYTCVPNSQHDYADLVFGNLQVGTTKNIQLPNSVTQSVTLVSFDGTKAQWIVTGDTSSVMYDRDTWVDPSCYPPSHGGCGFTFVQTLISEDGQLATIRFMGLQDVVGPTQDIAPTFGVSKASGSISYQGYNISYPIVIQDSMVVSRGDMLYIWYDVLFSVSTRAPSGGSYVYRYRVVLNTSTGTAVDAGGILTDIQGLPATSGTTFVSKPTIGKCIAGSFSSSTQAVVMELTSTGYNMRCMDPGDIASNIGIWYADNASKPYQFTLADVNGDQFDEVVNPSGIYTLDNEPTKLAAFNFSSTDGTWAIDLDSDNIFDLLHLSNNSGEIYISDGVTTAQVSCGGSGNLSVARLFCQAGANGLISAVPQGVSVSSYCEYVTYRTILSKNGVAIASLPDSPTRIIGGQLQTQSYIVSEPGVYEIDAIVHNIVTDEQANVSCIVTQTSFNPTPTFLNVSCSWDPDGDFNYAGESVAAHRWIVDSFSEPVITAAGFAQFDATPVIMFHSLGCAAGSLYAEVKMRSVDSPDVRYDIEGIFDNSLNPVASVRVANGSLYAISANGQEVVAALTESGSFHTILMAVDANAQTFNVSLDGTLLVSGKPFITAMNGNFAGARVISLAPSSSNSLGKFDMDYFHIWGSTDARSTLNSSQKAQVNANVKLAGCVGSGERNFDVNPAGHGSGYGHIVAYCTSVGIGQNGICLYDDLRNAVRVNPRCYAEAYAYCVNVTYPQTGLGGAIDPSQQIQQSGLDGAAACGMALSTSVMTTSVLVPLWKVVWGIVTANILLSIVILFIIVLAIMVIARPR